MILPVHDAMTGEELSKIQIPLICDLIARGFRIVSNGADGANPERDCQRRISSHAHSEPHIIVSPDGRLPDLVIPILVIAGNSFVNTQDPSHGRKTGRNNGFTGAKALVLGNFTIRYDHLQAIREKWGPDGPFYNRDFWKMDRMSELTAHRHTGAECLSKLVDNPSENMGAIVYYFILGDLCDAYESRTMAHVDRARIAIRAILFHRSWRLFLQKHGYAKYRHYVSPAAEEIFQIMSDALLGLIVIHRKEGFPLLPWKHGSMANERVFAAMRAVSKDFSLVEAIVMMPHLLATMTAASGDRYKKNSLKQTGTGYTHTALFEDESLDYKKLAVFPSDLELQRAYADANEEVDAFLNLLGCPPSILDDMPEATAPEENDADESDDEVISEDAVPNVSARDELQDAIGMITHATSLRKDETEQINACAAAAASLVVESMRSM